VRPCTRPLANGGALIVGIALASLLRRNVETF
jgi:hypothetical protein